MKKLYILLAVLSIGMFFNACTETPVDPEPVEEHIHVVAANDEDPQTTVQTLFITVEDGDTIHFEAGTYNFSTDLSMEGKNNIVIRGEGRDNTTLSFADQTAGAQGILVSNCTFF